MGQLEILEYPDPRLRLSAEPVTEFDSNLSQLVDDLVDTLFATTGIGLSATQVDVQQRVFVLDLSERASEPEIYVNPEILSKSAWGLVEESCLSVPDVTGNVIRPTKVEVRAQDRAGKLFERSLTGMHAVCLLHEMDHLVGKLFIDRLSIFRRFHIRILAKKKAARNRSAA